MVPYRRRRLICLCVGLTAGQTLPASWFPAHANRLQQHKTTLKAEEAAIRAVIRRGTTAWASGNGAAYASAFTSDADYITYGGMLQKGRRKIADAHQQLFDGPLKDTSLQGSIRSVRFLGPDMAVAHGTYGILFPGQQEVGPDRKSVQTFVLVKRNGKWRITASQVTRVLPQT